MQVIKRKLHIIKSVATQGISNDVAKENRKQFVAEAMKDYARQSRGKSYCLRLLTETRYS